MNGRFDGGGSAAERLSALVDGEAGAQRAGELSAAWAEDAQLRATWHSYQLIGDVLRSEDLASNGARDRAFLDVLSARLAQEPVVLAPAPAVIATVEASPRRSRGNWVAPAAIAASVVAVSGWVLRPAVPPVAQIAAAPPASAAARAVAAIPAPVRPFAAAPLAGPTMLRDEQLDGYFAAHKQFAGRTAFGMPSSFVRNASVEVPAR